MWRSAGLQRLASKMTHIVAGMLLTPLCRLSGCPYDMAAGFSSVSDERDRENIHLRQGITAFL